MERTVKYCALKKWGMNWCKEAPHILVPLDVLSYTQSSNFAYALTA